MKLKFLSMLEKFLLTLVIIAVLIVAYTVSEASEYRPASYQNLSIETELTEEQLSWKPKADNDWKKEFGELQTNLTYQHEREIRQNLRGM